MDVVEPGGITYRTIGLDGSCPVGGSGGGWVGVAEGVGVGVKVVFFGNLFWCLFLSAR